MKPLGKAQKEVIKDMRDGVKLYYNRFSQHVILAGSFTSIVKKRVFISLSKRQLIETEKMTDARIYYQLTGRGKTIEI